MVSRQTAVKLVALCAFWPASAAHACAVCDSPTGQQVRAGLFNGHFLHTLLLVTAPFPVFAGVVLGLYVCIPDLPEIGDGACAQRVPEIAR